MHYLLIVKTSQCSVLLTTTTTVVVIASSRTKKWVFIQLRISPENGLQDPGQLSLGIATETESAPA